MKENLLIVDGNYMMVRAVCANPNLISSIGEPSGGIYIFLKSLAFLMKESPKAIVCFDGGHNLRREKIWPEYKANRHKNKDEQIAKALEFSFEKIVPILRMIGLTTVRIGGEEADDIIYAYAKHFSDQYNVIVASDDSDYLQMVDENVKICRPIKGDYITLNNFEEIIGYKPKYHVFYKSLIGDTSDNIPNPCRGVGKVTASKIINWFNQNNLEPTLENLVAYSKVDTKSIFQKLVERESLRNLKRNLFLIDISRVASDEKCKDYLRELTIAKELINPDPKELMKLFNRWEIKTLPQWIIFSKQKLEAFNGNCR